MRLFYRNISTSTDVPVSITILFSQCVRVRVQTEGGVALGESPADRVSICPSVISPSMRINYQTTCTVQASHMATAKVIATLSALQKNNFLSHQKISSSLVYSDGSQITLRLYKKIFFSMNSITLTFVSRNESKLLHIFKYHPPRTPIILVRWFLATQFIST